MGFLDHSTNNIIVDAVLTDKGRKALANSNFSIQSFSLADDEVDYTIIQKFGRTVGKEKIIKNTPIFEAQTSSDLAQKHRLMSLNDQTVIYLPTTTLSGDADKGVVTIDSSGSGASSQGTIVLTQTIQGVTNPALKIPTDSGYFVEIPNRFLGINGVDGMSATKGASIDVYSINATTPDDGSTISEISFMIHSLGLDDTVFNTFGTNTTKNRIDCIVGIVGKSTGFRTTVNVVINKV